MVLKDGVQVGLLYLTIVPANVSWMAVKIRAESLRTNRTTPFLFL